jgi:nicotinamidase-related amidase
MSAFKDRPNTALVVIDVQNDVVAKAFKRNQVINNIAQLVSNARSQQVPVVWVQHSDDELVKDTFGWEYVAELQSTQGEPVIHKSFGDSFEDTDLEDVLSELKVGKLIVCGAQSDACIRSTLHGAITRGYDATLVSDAHTTDDCTYSEPPVSAEQIISHTNFYWNWQRTASARGGTVKSADLGF